MKSGGPGGGTSTLDAACFLVFYLAPRKKLLASMEIFRATKNHYRKTRNIPVNDLAILNTHPVVAYFGINWVKAALGYQIKLRNVTEDNYQEVEAEMLETILHDEDKFFQWVADFVEGNF